MIQTPKSDAQGFLIGDPIDIGVALKIWDSIQKDVQAIRKAVTGAAANLAGTKHQPDREQTAAAVALPSGRRGGNTNAASRRTQTPPGRSQHTVAALWNEPRAATKAVAIPAGRDRSGRFVAGNTSIDGGLHDRVPRAGDSAIQGFADSVVSAVNGASAGIEEADPAVKAFNEVAQPMARGYEMISGRNKEKGQEGWLRRIYSSLTGFRKEETAYSKAANKSLKTLEEKPEAKGGGDGGGLLGMMSGLLSKIPVIGPMLAGGAGMMGGAGKGLMGAGKGLLGAGKGMLRRIPLLGALIGGVGAASDIYSSETDDSLTRRQKDENAGKAVGGFAGSVGGMLAGAKLGAMAGAIGGPIGVAIGGVLGGAVGMFFGDQAGQIIGDTVGGWVSDLREADIPGKIVGAWEATTDFLKKGWDGALEKLSDAWKGIKDAGSQAAQWASDKANSANNFIKDKTGVDVKGAAVAVKEKAVEVGTKAAEKVQQGAEYVSNNTTVGKGVKAAGNWVLGQTSKLFESGKGGAATVSSGKGDYGGASYGTYQLSSKQGEVQKFLKGSKYGEQFAGLQPGTPEFNAKWKEVAKADPEFGNVQHDYIKATKFDPAMAGLKKAGIDLSKDGAAVQDAVWSTSVQFGAGGAQSLVKNAFKGKNVSKMTEAEKISAIQDYKIANNDKLFSKSDDNVRAGTAKRAVEEKKRLLALADQDTSASPAVNDTIGGGTQTAQAGQITYPQKAPVEVAAISSPKAPALVATASLANVQTAHIAMPPVVSPPSIPAVSEPPPVVDTLASNAGSGRKTQAITVAAPEVGQDLKDRRIAHIVTGGLSAT